MGIEMRRELDAGLEQLVEALADVTQLLGVITAPSPDAATIRQQTHELIGQSAALSFDMFGQFLRPLGERSRRVHLPSR